MQIAEDGGVDARERQVARQREQHDGHVPGREGGFVVTIAVYNLFSDICILLVPQRIIWRLNMSLERKLGMALIFAVGLL